MAEKIAANSSPQDVWWRGQPLVKSATTTILVGLFAPQLVEILACEAYSSAVPLIRILAIAGVGQTLGAYLGLFLDAIGNAAFNLKMLLISFATNLLLGLIFLPLFGLLGAAFATGAGVVLTTAIGQYFLQKQMAIRPWLLKFN
ncbi:MAG: polysaccharide biosynthesis C-terminal domain-containing protein [Saprospiraceae bacterium]